MCGICGVVGGEPVRARAGARRASSLASTIAGPTRAGSSRRLGRGSPRTAWRSSTSSPAIRRSPTRTGRSASSSTARSTTTASCATELRARGHEFRSEGDTEVHRPPGRGAARRWSSRGGSTACSRSRSGTSRRSGCVLGRDRVGKKPLFYWPRRRPAGVRQRDQGAARRPRGAAPRSTRAPSPRTSHSATCRRRAPSSRASAACRRATS